MSLDIYHCQYVAAVHQRARKPGSRIDLIVIHDGETNEGPTAAEGMAAYFASGHTTGSAHLCVDNNSVVRCAPDENRTNGAGGVNEDGLHLEQAGRASQTTKEWDDAYSDAVIANAASCCRQWITHHPNIRKEFIDAARLRNGERNGITSHREVTLAGFAGNDGHSDPGPYYPIKKLMALIKDGTDHPHFALEEAMFTIDNMSYYWYMAGRAPGGRWRKLDDAEKYTNLVVNGHKAFNITFATFNLMDT